jgi:hypothetical protein
MPFREFGRNRRKMAFSKNVYGFSEGKNIKQHGFSYAFGAWVF